MTEPDDDWAPVLFAEDEWGQLTVIGFPVLDDREATVAILRLALAKVGAVRYAVVLSSWAATSDHVPPSENPNRQELLTLLLSDPETDMFYAAPILRRNGAPPQLGSWQRWTAFEGRFAGLLRGNRKEN